MTTTATTASRIRHRADCRKVDLYETVGALGDMLLRCRSCHRFALLGASSSTTPARPVAAPERPAEPREVLEMPRPPRVRRAAAQRAAEPAPAPVLLVRRWRCGNHPANAVTWRGTGCPECEEARAARQRAREDAARRRRAEREVER